MDVFAAVREYLLSGGTSLKDLVEDRVYVGGIPMIERKDERTTLIFDNTKPGIVLRGAGGGGSDQVDAERPSIDIFCYGGADIINSVAVRRPHLAMRTYNAVREAMRGGKTRLTKEGKVSPVQLELGPTPQTDPETGWPVVICTYQFWVYTAKKK